MFDILEGKTIILRKARLSDLESAYKNIWSDESLFKYMFYDTTKSIEDAYSRLERTIKYQSNNFAYFISLKKTDEVIGFCGISHLGDNIYQETGLCITSKYQMVGIGFQVALICFDLVFNKLKGEKLICECMENNTNSKGLINKLNFKLFDKYTTISIYDNLEHVIECYEIYKEDYLNFINTYNESHKKHPLKI